MEQELFWNISNILLNIYQSVLYRVNPGQYSFPFSGSQWSRVDKIVWFAVPTKDGMIRREVLLALNWHQRFHESKQIGNSGRKSGFVERLMSCDDCNPVWKKLSTISMDILRLFVTT
jgi:hypothetical protein